MGLDQYLTKKIYIGANYKHREIAGKIEITERGKPIEVEFNKVSYIEESAVYWRKANQIHRWFVENVQDGEDDCKSYYVSNEQLKELVSLCKQVLEDHSLAETLLPVQEGCFFENNEYNEYYFKQLQKTIDQLTPYLEDAENEFSYTSSW